MAVKRAVDRNLTPKERLHRLLGMMLDTTLSETRKREYAAEVTQIISGYKINSDWMTQFGLKGTTGVENNMGYIDIYVPPESVPAWYKLKADKHEVDPRPKIRFYLQMRETQGSQTEGIGPVNPQNPMQS